jgi:hypothetical protein
VDLKLKKSTRTSAMNLLAEFGPGYYNQPARLYAASRDLFSAAVDANGLLTIRTKPNYIGSFSVQVSVTDGTCHASRLRRRARAIRDR